MTFTALMASRENPTDKKLNLGTLSRKQIGVAAAQGVLFWGIFRMLFCVLFYAVLLLFEIQAEHGNSFSSKSKLPYWNLLGWE